MVKKKRSAAATGAGSSNIVSKAASDAETKAASEASAVATKGAPGDWPASTTSKRDMNKAWTLGLIPDEVGNVILPGSGSRLNPLDGFSVMFIAFLYRGLSFPTHEFLRRLVVSYGIQLWQLTPNSILHLAIFITLCEAFLGIDPHWGLWKKIFFVKHYNCNNGSFVTGGVGFFVRKDVNYFNFPIRESVVKLHALHSRHLISFVQDYCL
jgi:hypothetical protein